MIHLFIQYLRQRGVRHVVSPYESDAQLAYLFKKKEIDFVVTEDSDLLAYGVTRVLTKMDLTGRGYEINLARLHLCEDYVMQSGSEFT